MACWAIRVAQSDRSRGCLSSPVTSLQAQARAHRIGQARDVLVLRLLASSTIEEHILDVAEQKRKFADSSITGALADQTPTARQHLVAGNLRDCFPASGLAHKALFFESISRRAE